MKPVCLFSLILFFSCSPARTNNSKIKLTEDKYNYYYEQSTPFINLSLLGDYKFQPFTTKYFRDIDKRFIKYSTSGFNYVKPEILYSAHTIVQPYYSSIFIQYKNCRLDTTLINSLKTELKSNLKTSFSKPSKIICGTKEAYKIVFQIKHALTKIYSSHAEYFFSNGQTVYRLLLWTTNSDDAVISNEAEYIIKEAKFK